MSILRLYPDVPFEIEIVVYYSTKRGLFDDSEPEIYYDWEIMWPEKSTEDA